VNRFLNLLLFCLNWQNTVALGRQSIQFIMACGFLQFVSPPVRLSTGNVQRPTLRVLQRVPSNGQIWPIATARLESGSRGAPDATNPSGEIPALLNEPFGAGARQYLFLVFIPHPRDWLLPVLEPIPEPPISPPDPVTETGRQRIARRGRNRLRAFPRFFPGLTMFMPIEEDSSRYIYYCDQGTVQGKRIRV
jgi:hypothetical protein